MKHLVKTLVVLAITAAAAGTFAFRATGDKQVERALAKQDAMEWLRADFQLTDEQFGAIKQLHDSYSVVCEQHCRDIMQAVRTRNELKAQPNAAPDAVSTAERRVEEKREICESAITTHVRQCASHMSPESGQRYLALILPKIKDFDHQAAPDLQLNRHGH